MELPADRSGTGTGTWAGVGVLPPALVEPTQTAAPKSCSMTLNKTRRLPLPGRQFQKLLDLHRTSVTASPGRHLSAQPHKSRCIAFKAQALHYQRPAGAVYMGWGSSVPSHEHAFTPRLQLTRVADQPSPSLRIDGHAQALSGMALLAPGGTKHMAAGSWGPRMQVPAGVETSRQGGQAGEHHRPADSSA